MNENEQEKTYFNGLFLPLIKFCIMKPAVIDPEYKDLIEQIGMKILELRKEKNVTYVDMAKKVGLSKNGYNNIELGYSNFQIQTLLKILSYHRISVFDFFQSLKR